jgi:hypothetical protein
MHTAIQFTIKCLFQSGHIPKMFMAAYEQIVPKFFLVSARDSHFLGGEPAASGGRVSLINSN